ncbi:hypothetical protein BH11BAC1_BH11BAC1_18170 [soil metagenome]
MKQYVLFSVLLFISTVNGSAQSAFPTGGYRNIDELRKKQPSMSCDFHPVARIKEEILYNGGNDYFMRCEEENADQKMITTALYAVSIGSTLFLNTLVHQLATGYANVISEGRYMLFYSGFKDKKKKRTLSIGIAAGRSQVELSIPSTTRAVLANAKPPKRFLLAIDLQTGLLTLCDRIFLIQVLKPFPDIEYQYALEPEQNSEQTLINYMQMVNKASGTN